VSVQHYLALFVVSAAVTLLLTPVARRLGLKYGVVARPGGRSVHKGEVARVGGVAMFLGVSAAIGVQILGERYLGWGGGLFSDRISLGGVYLSFVAILATGLVDDIMGLKAGPKLAGQLAAAAIAVASGLRIEYIGNPFGGGGLIALGMLGIPVTLLYFVGFTNVINLIDGLDGLAAGISAIAATSLLVLAAQGNHFVAAALAAALIGACLGFLRYNFYPASIFMGDSGSNFLGFALAAISLLGVMKTVAAIALAVPLLIIGVPIFDTASAIARRVMHGRPIQEADKGHIHHRLLHRGFDQRQTVLIIYVWSAALAVGAYAVRYAPGFVKILAFAVLALLSGIMAYWLGLYESAHHHDASSEQPTPGDETA
jgi:UDP-GlcNAc:undecaprenyl-phosphate GlcNAc-1-phosphate transferase